MSIPDEAAAQAAQHDEQFLLMIIVPLALAGLVLAWGIGVFRRRSIAGPSRIGDGEPLGMLLVVMGGAVVALIMAQIFCMVILASPKGATQPSTAATTPTTHAIKLTPAQTALSVSVPPLIAFAFMVIANKTIRPRGLSELGLSKSPLGRGMVTGLIGSLIAVPVTFLASWATQLLWKQFQFEHPTEHDLLRIIRENPSPSLAVVLVASAVLIAPLAEETAFRGHLQTFITHGLSRLKQWFTRRPTARGFDVVLPGGSIGYVALPDARPPLDPPTAAMRWVSVLMTSVLFSLVHPLWMTPPIFVLAVCLGYAYERTGNLWTTITMHAIFNTTSTVLFLMGMR